MHLHVYFHMYKLLIITIMHFCGWSICVCVFISLISGLIFFACFSFVGDFFFLFCLIKFMRSIAIIIVVILEVVVVLYEKQK